MLTFKLKRPLAHSTDFNTVAAVDLGSNSFHMVVARLQGNELSPIDKLREMVRLAAGLDKAHVLSAEAQHRALACLERFGQRLSGMPQGSVRAVGTNTLRSAHNARAFIAVAEEALGHPIEIISGREEARLIYLGVAQSTPDNSGQRLIVDIGGGSTECIIGRDFQTRHLESQYMGCVSMSQRFFADGEITRKRWEDAVLACAQEIEPIAARYRSIGWETVLGASGTIKAIQCVAQEAGWIKTGITPVALNTLAAALIEAGHVNKLKLSGLGNDRAAVFPGGVAVLYATFKALNIESMEVSEGALREGLLYDLTGRIRHEDVRHRSATSLAERYHVDVAQAERIRQTAWACLAQVATDWGLEDEEAKRFLGWAAQLHEVGLGIAHNHYHKHGAYIIENSDMPGFSRLEQQYIAALVRVHRRKFATGIFNALSTNWRESLTKLAVLLRLSLVLHRSRVETPLPKFTLKVRDTHSLALCFPENWLDTHPLTRADLEQESTYLKVAQFKLHVA